MAPPYGRGTKQCCDPSICPYVCLSRFLILSLSLDGGMGTSPFQVHSVEGSTVGNAHVEMLSAGGVVVSPTCDRLVRNYLDFFNIIKIV